jgi:CSLREA domain-containing protein
MTLANSTAYRRLLIGLVLGAALTAALLTAMQGSARGLVSQVAASDETRDPDAVLVVDSLGDAPDRAPGDGYCQTAQWVCSLRAAIEEANAWPGPDTIRFAANLPAGATIAVASPLTITQGLAIHGPEYGALAIDGNEAVRLFTVDSPQEPVEISGLTLRNGANPTGPGGALYVATHSLVRLTGLALEDNSAQHGGAIAVGDEARLTVVSSTLSSNVASGNGGAILVADSSSTLSVQGSAFDTNSADGSGGAIAGSGVMTITGTVFNGNHADVWGGALKGYNVALFIEGSRFLGNSAGQGGAVHASPFALDVFLLQDETHSFTNDLADLQALAPEIWDAIADGALDFQLGIGGFRDFARGDWGEAGDWVYRRVQDLTKSRGEFTAAVHALSALRGADPPEAQLEALHYLATPDHPAIDSNGNGQTTDPNDTPMHRQPQWRPHAARVVLLATDYGCHVAGDAGGWPGDSATQSPAVTAEILNEAEITVIGLIPDADDPIFCVSELTSRTGGSVQETTDSGVDIKEAILAGLSQLKIPVKAADGAIRVAALTDYQSGVSIADSEFADNSASSGGALQADFHDVVITGSAFVANRATGGEGGEEIAGSGGAILCRSSSLDLVNSTLSGNSAVQDGGGLFLLNDDAGQNAVVEIASSTIVTNAANVGGGVYLTNAGGDATLRARNSLLAGNRAAQGSECARVQDITTPGTAVFESRGHNVTVQSAGSGCSFSAPGDRFVPASSVFTRVVENVPLYNGGPTPTHRLLATSPAIDQGNTAGCQAPSGAALLVDQRGVRRPLGSACDIGAVEMILPGVDLTKTVGSDPGVCSGDSYIRAPRGSEVYYCLMLENTGNVTLTQHVVDDWVLGVNQWPLDLPLAPGEAIELPLLGPVSIQARTVNTATVVSQPDPAVVAPLFGTGIDLSAASSSSATVDVFWASVELTKTVGPAGAPCASTAAIAVNRGSQVAYCLTVHNAGDAPFSELAITDASLGISVTLPVALAAGERISISGADLPGLVSGPITQAVTNTATLNACGAFTSPDLRYCSSDDASAQVLIAGVALTKTVGTQAGVCAATSAITVDQGTAVHYCLTACNDGDVPFNELTVEDASLGINTTWPVAFAASQCMSFTGADIAALDYTIYQTMTNTASLMACGNSLGQGASYCASDLGAATVEVLPVYDIIPTAMPINIVGKENTVLAEVADLLGNPAAGIMVAFTVTGLNENSGNRQTDPAGRASYTYTGTNNTLDLTDTDIITASLGVTNSTGPARASTVWRGITMTVAGSVVGSWPQAVRTITTTAHIVDAPQETVPGLLVRLRVSGGTTVSKNVETDITGRAVLTYTSIAPHGLLPASTGTQGQAAAPNDTDIIEVWIDLDRNGEPNIPNLNEPYRRTEVVTAITLVAFTGQLGDGGAVRLDWQTAVEIDSAGFNVYRAAAASGPYLRINPLLIPAVGMGGGASYSYSDAPPGPGVYYYQLEEVDVRGVSTFYGPVSVDVPSAERRIYLPIFYR